MTIRLYVEPDDSGCQRVAWVLGRKGLEFETVVVGEAERAHLDEHAEGAPAPVVFMGNAEGDIIAGATAIAYFLERAHGEPSLFPVDPRRRNQAVTMNEFAEEVILRARTEGDHEALLACLDQTRNAIEKAAIGRPDEIHLGDIAVAVELDALSGNDEVNRIFPDLLLYAAGIRRSCTGR